MFDYYSRILKITLLYIFVFLLCHNNSIFTISIISRYWWMFAKVTDFRFLVDLLRANKHSDDDVIVSS